MGNHLLFAANVAAHLVALMSGIASFVLATVSAIKKKPIIESWFWIAGAICLIAAFDGAWQDEHRNTETVITEKASAYSLANGCLQDRRVEDAYMKGLEGMNNSQRQTIDSQQNSITSQQKDVSSCVVSLGKMNPIVRREVRVLIIPFGVIDAKINKFVGIFSTNKLYTSEVVITTNEDQLRPSGYLRCTEPFKVIGIPQLPMISQTAMVGNSMPVAISDREYQISISNTGSYWGPSSPMYMPISSETENLSGCVFTPQ